MAWQHGESGRNISQQIMAADEENIIHRHSKEEKEKEKAKKKKHGNQGVA